MNKLRSPTIIDVAREAGVSKSAVSRALLGQGDVSPETLERVLAAADLLGYVPNAMARGLVSQRTMTLGVVLRDSTTQFYGYLQAAMQRRAAKFGYEVVSVTGVDDLTVEDAQKALRSLIALRVDGLIVSSAQLPGEDLVRYAQRVPIVVAGRAEYAEGIVSVHCDEEDGGGQIAEHVVKLGHRNVAVLLMSSDESPNGYTRGQAMIRTLEASGVTVHVMELDAYRAPVGLAVMKTLADPAITALMCPSDITMVNVLEELRVQGIPIPGRLSVTGYDAFGTLAAPFFGFTSFRLPVEEIGTTAIDRVIELIEAGVTSEKRTAIPGVLVPGRTAAPPRR
ncbi:LacI family DNA-binding transcriptional regulator [Arthrobacter ramosus]|uniref:LacI family DNA-binding transcriptional regulator n=1 Tax=Arthrobacter ramosus TaxID=1672 RepID=A0ABV5XWR5_ARTRM|nr:LacI family DNA-binding transcriptional regulator [Arthrobacter ramosus]